VCETAVVVSEAFNVMKTLVQALEGVFSEAFKYRSNLVFSEAL
jgi:hypothetical protein